MKDLTAPDYRSGYTEMIAIIERSREKAFRAVNRELITMYWEIGRYISGKMENGGWGKSVVADFARYVQEARPDIKGFSASNIWRMRQFYETYRQNDKLAPLVREISWTQNLLIMSRARTEEARAFYIALCRKNNYSKRELERQMDSMLFERSMVSEERNKLLFYNRELSCLVAIELKVTDFRPEHLGQLEFYLEALDRDVKKPGENPSVGLILCAGKDDTVVEYALSRSMSPALIAEYQLHLPNRVLLAEKLRELRELADVEAEGE